MGLYRVFAAGVPLAGVIDTWVEFVIRDKRLSVPSCTTTPLMWGANRKSV